VIFAKTTGQSMSDKNVVILISGSGSNLQAFIEAQKSDQFFGQVKAVISNIPDAYGLTRATNAGIENICVSHKNFDTRLAFDNKLAEVIQTFEPDLIILAGFMRILTAEFVAKFRGKLLNIHPSLLPKYPGLHTHRKALENKDSHHGTSVHFVTEELDGGPIVAQAKTAIEPEDTEESLTRKVQALEHKLYPHVAKLFLAGKIRLENQGVYFDDKHLQQPISI
jgi:phosphoribosylglycinamide formyltransferase 1